MGKYLRHARAKGRNHFFVEPGIAPEPQIIARAGVRQRNDVRPVFAPGLNRRSDRCAIARQVVRLRVLADGQRELDSLQA